MKTEKPFLYAWILLVCVYYLVSNLWIKRSTGVSKYKGNFSESGQRQSKSLSTPFWYKKAIFRQGSGLFTNEDALNFKSVRLLVFVMVV